MRHVLSISSYVKSLPSALLHPLPVCVQMEKWQVVSSSLCEKYIIKKAIPPCSSNSPHKCDLDADGRSAVEMYLPRILSHQADRDALNRADVIDGTLLVEIRQRDMAAGFIDRDGRDRRSGFSGSMPAFSHGKDRLCGLSYPPGLNHEVPGCSMSPCCCSSTHFLVFPTI